MTFLNDTSNFRTPSKKQKETMMSDEGTDGTLGISDFVGRVRTLPEDLTKELDDVISNSVDKGLLTRTVARLESSMITQGTALEAVAELSYKRFLANERDLRSMSGAVQNVQFSVGQPIELATRFDAPTLWSATSFVAEEVERVAGGLKILEDDMGPVRSALLEVNQELAKMAKSGQSEKMLKVLVMVSNKVKEASGEIVGLKAKVVSLEAAVSKAATNKQGGKGTRTSLGDGEDDPELDHLMEDFQNSGVSQHEARRGKVTPEKVEREGVGRVERDAQLAMIMGEVTRLT